MQHQTTQWAQWSLEGVERTRSRKLEGDVQKWKDIKKTVFESCTAGIQFRDAEREKQTSSEETYEQVWWR